MADVDVVLRCFEDGWHYRCDRPLQNEVNGVESVEESFQSNDELRSSQANASDSEAAGSIGKKIAKNSAVVHGDRSMDSVKEDEDHIIRTKSEMKRVFDTYDANGDGQICQGELGSFMKKLDVDVSEEELASMMKSVDVNNDGHVDFEEFLKLHTALVEKEEQTEPGNEHDEEAELREAFEVFDKNNDGFISVIELQSVLRSLGINTGVKIQDVKKMIAVVDTNNDGQVDFTEFKQLMNSLPSETP